MIVWTPDFLTAVATLWVAGRTGSEIAQAVGQGLSRNAVITKMSRIGLTRDVCGDPQAVAKALRAATRKAKIYEDAIAKVAPVPRPPLPVIAPSRTGGFANLGDALLATLPEPLPCGMSPRQTPVCLWGLGSPGAVRFCGLPATHSAHRLMSRPVYCPEHGPLSLPAEKRDRLRAAQSLPVHA